MEWPVAREDCLVPEVSLEDLSADSLTRFRSGTGQASGTLIVPFRSDSATRPQRAGILLCINVADKSECPSVWPSFHCPLDSFEQGSLERMHRSQRSRVLSTCLTRASTSLFLADRHASSHSFISSRICGIRSKSASSLFVKLGLP